MTENEEKLYYNGEILTLEDDLYVEALLVCNGIIKALGKKEDVIKIANKKATFVDLQGKTLMPSFMDAHSHFSGYAASLTQVDLSETINFKEINERIQSFIIKNHIKKGQWIQATGYDQNLLKEKVHPTKDVLDQVTPDNPLVIKHASGHMGVFNSFALEKLDIHNDTEALEGGKIEKINGQITGYIEEAAFMNYITKLPMISNEEFVDSFMRAQTIYASYGITTIQEGYFVEQLLPIYQYLIESNQLKLDIMLYMDINHAAYLKENLYACLNRYKNHVKVKGYKTFLDGSPQGRTAWMRTPYLEDEKNYYGYGTQKDEEIYEKICYAMNDHMQLLVHCNGDAACNQYIGQYEKALQLFDLQIFRDLRPVIIHAQFLGLDQLEQVKKLGMIPSFFVDHVYYWGDVHIQNFGLDRARSISPAASAQKKGIVYTFHQDSPVIEPDMLHTIWTAVNRLTKENVILGKEQRITTLDAIKAVTCNAAYQYYEEDCKGTLKIGKNADFVILDQNILKVNPMQIKDIRVVETIKDGNTIFNQD
jgi:predicted amidohydrolase YtcJ